MMRNGIVRSTVAIVALAAGLGLATSRVAGQGVDAILAPKGPASAPGARMPRMPDGKPDLQGIYQPDSHGGAPNNNIEEHPPSFLRTGGKSVVIDPPDGKIPYQPWALAERDRRRNPSHTFDDPEGHCFLSGVPRQMYISGGGGVFQILHTSDHVLILFEYIHAYRIIPTDGRIHLTAAIRKWEGDSIGRWDGDTLVVDTTNNNGKTWFELSGNFVSDAVRQIERFKMADLNTINYEATIDDPKVFTRPWKMALDWRRVQEQQGYTEILEQACHEGNQDLVHTKAVQEKRERGAGK